MYRRLVSERREEQGVARAVILGGAHLWDVMSGEEMKLR